MNFKPIAWCAVCIAIASPTFGQEPKAESQLSISFPGKNWALVVSSPGFSVQSNGPKSDGRQYLLANNHQNEIELSITLERSPRGADPKTCDGYLHERAKSLAAHGPTNIKYSEISNFSVLEYFLPKFQNIPVKQQNVVACTARDDVYVDIHLSKTLFQASEEHLFIDILNALRFSDQPPSQAVEKPTTPSNQTSADYVREGSRHFLDQDFKGAIAPYQSALDLEVKQPQLEKNMWRVLVDNLGMAYGITGDLDRSEQVYEYGISKDPDFPSFYYSLVCVYADRADMDKTMEYLRKAFSLKANVLPGESMPDPAKDESFQRFMANPKFRDFVKGLNASN